MADWLSQNNCIGLGDGTFKSRRRAVSHTSSHVAVAIARYSSSALDREITYCFFERQETGLEPKVIKKPVTERRVVGQLAQSESVYATSYKSQSEEKNRPCPGVPLI